MAAISQLRHRDNEGRACLDPKVGDDKTKREAIRALKRQISNAVYDRSSRTPNTNPDPPAKAGNGGEGPGPPQGGRRGSGVREIHRSALAVPRPSSVRRCSVDLRSWSTRQSSIPRSSSMARSRRIVPGRKVPTCGASGRRDGVWTPMLDSVAHALRVSASMLVG